MIEYKVLNQIKCIEDLWSLPEERLDRLCYELRSFMIQSVSQTGGHLASGLGAVELIVALHRVYRSPQDKIIFDVGHQSYAHKILTGRMDSFSSLRQQGGISGFPKREESIHDAFNTGHASTSVSAVLGMLRAMELQGQEGCGLAFIGDGALTGGLAYEALDDAGDSRLPLVVLLNDNHMSISPNVGAMSRNLSSLRSSKGYNKLKRFVVRLLDTGPVGRFFSKRLENFKNRVKRFVLNDTFFESMGFTYLGPIDGHDVHAVIHILSEAKALRRPVLVHAITQKGRGYAFSEEDPEKFHGIKPFSVKTGETRPGKGQSCSQTFGDAMVELAGERDRLCAITAAMPAGTGLKHFARQFPKRFFDVGIAEEHAITMAAGMACQGMEPVVAIYASFLQRGMDNILHDVCLQKLPVVFAVDRAGLVGEDGETHQGLYDAAMLSVMPHMSIYMPSDLQQLSAMVKLAVERKEPAAIRYNRGSLPWGAGADDLVFGRWKQLKHADRLYAVAAGTILEQVKQAAEGLPVGVIEARFYKPLDEPMLDSLARAGSTLLVVEENAPCLGSAIALSYPGLKLHCLNTGDQAVPQGSIEQQRKLCHLDAQSIRNSMQELLDKIEE